MRGAIPLVPLVAAIAVAPSAARVADARIDVSKLHGRIAFAAGSSKEGEEIYVVDADGSQLRRLTRNAVFDFDPSWSPDGKRIAFRSERTGNDDIYVMNADGSQPRNVTRTKTPREWGPAWSPNGQTIAFNSDRRTPGRRMELYTARPDGSTTKRLSHVYVEYPAWSPDGRMIAFMSQTPEGTENYEIYVMNSDGSHVRRLTRAPGSDGFPAWSPDGTRLAFTSERDDCGRWNRPRCERSGLGTYMAIYVMNADGSRQRRLTRVFGQFAAWSPDGHFILVAPAPGGFYVVKPDGSGLTRLPVAGVGDTVTPDWR